MRSTHTLSATTRASTVHSSDYDATVPYVVYMLLISPTMRCRNLLFIARGLQTLGRLLATTREPSLGPEPMVNTNPGIPGDPTCPVPLNPLAFEQQVLATLFYPSLTLWLLMIFVCLEKLKSRLKGVRRGF